METRIDQLTGLRLLLEDSEEALAPAPIDLPAAAGAPPDGCPVCDPAAAGLEEVGGESGVRVLAWSAAVEPAEAPGSARDSGLSSLADPLRASGRGTDAGLFGSEPGGALTELIAPTEHGVTLAELSAERIEALTAAWRGRISAHAERAAFVGLSLDQDPAAGLHGAAMIRALDFVPAEVARERERSAAYHERTMGGHLLGDVGTAEIRRRERFVAIDDEAILFCPWASRAPYELRIVPREPAPRYEESGGAAAMIATAVALLADVLGPGAPLGLWIRTAPRGAPEFCWHIDLVPGRSAVGAFELSTGVAVNRLAPERAAERLRASHAERRRAATAEGG